MPSPEESDRFASTEEWYADGRPGYGDAALTYLVERFDLDDDACVLDLGCGTGQLTIPLAAHAGEVMGMDPHPAMLRKAREAAATAGRNNIQWVEGSDTDLENSLGPLRLTTMGRSFHWMEGKETLEILYTMTESDGGVAILDDEEWLTRGDQAWQESVYELVEHYLDDLPPRQTDNEEYKSPWDELVVECGFKDVEVVEFEVEREWTIDDIVAYVFSLSFCSPETFGDDVNSFETDLRTFLQDSGGPFIQTAEMTVIAGRK